MKGILEDRAGLNGHLLQSLREDGGRYRYSRSIEQLVLNRQGLPGILEDFHLLGG
jgi:hypothetical protein